MDDALKIPAEYGICWNVDLYNNIEDSYISNAMDNEIA